MKKMSLKFLVVLFSAMTLVFATSCDKDEDPKPGDDGTPVLGVNFDFTINENTVNFTSSLTGSVWVTNTVTSVNTDFVEGVCSVFIANAGTYAFTCNTLVDGATISSEPFDVVITQSDLSFLNEGVWLYLTGGEGKTKTWKMDMNADGLCKYFDGPMYFSGAEIDKVRYPYWAWDVYPQDLPYTLQGKEMTDLLAWKPDYAGNKWIMAPGDYGTITFKGDDFTVSTDIFGEAKNGSFQFDTATWKLSLTGVILPTDTSRLNEPQFLDENLANVRIFTLTDSAMQIGIKRSYEGKDETTGAQKVSEWVCVYNFICADYTYEVPEEFTYSESVKTSFTAADLEGTWKYADVPQGWVAYTATGDQGTTIPAHLLGKWDTRANVVADLVSWGAASADSTFTANDANTYVFNNDGTCTLAGIANTYTVASGIITFGTALSTEFSAVWITLTGTELKAIDFAHYGDAVEDYTQTGLWIGNQNGEKSEYQAVQLVKQ